MTIPYFKLTVVSITMVVVSNITDVESFVSFVVDSEPHAVNANIAPMAKRITNSFFIYGKYNGNY